MTTSQQLTAPTSRAPAAGARGTIVGLSVVIAALMVVSGLIHLHLLRGPYRHLTVGHMNTLFLIQVIACFVGALALLVMRNLLAVAAAGALMAGTFIGFLISRYRGAGLFGFHVPFTSSDAKWALAVEIAATVLCAVSAIILARSRQRS